MVDLMISAGSDTYEDVMTKSLLKTTAFVRGRASVDGSVKAKFLTAQIPSISFFLVYDDAT